MSLQTDLLSLERKFWTGDAEFYRQNLDDECLTAFNKPAGVSTKEEIAKAVMIDDRRWQNPEIDLQGLVEPPQEVAILAYRAAAVRANGEAYSALASSGYVRRDGSSKMTFHHQTPLAQDDPSLWARDPPSMSTRQRTPERLKDRHAFRRAT